MNIFYHMIRLIRRWILRREDNYPQAQIIQDRLKIQARQRRLRAWYQRGTAIGTHDAGEVCLSLEAALNGNIQIYGAPGSGKSMAVSLLLRHWVGFTDHTKIVVDPHGTLAERIFAMAAATYPAQEFHQKVAYLNFAHETLTPCLRLVVDAQDTREVDEAHRHLEQLFGTNYTLKQREIFETFLKVKGDLPITVWSKFAHDASFRERLLVTSSDPHVQLHRSQWAQLKPKQWEQLIQSLDYKIRYFSKDHKLRTIFGHPKRALNWRKLLQEKELIIINTDASLLGDSNSNLIAGVVFTQIKALRLREGHRMRSVHIVIDEAHRIIQSEAQARFFAEVIEQMRKRKTFMTLIGQNIATQYPTRMQHALFNGCKYGIFFRLDYQSAQIVTRQIYVPPSELSPPNYWQNGREFEGFLREQPLFQAVLQEKGQPPTFLRWNLLEIPTPQTLHILQGRSLADLEIANLRSLSCVETESQSPLHAQPAAEPSPTPPFEPFDPAEVADGVSAAPNEPSPQEPEPKVKSQPTQEEASDEEPDFWY